MSTSDELALGFRDGRGTYLTSNEYTGVWLSNVPLDCNEGAAGDELLSLEIPDEVITKYEWIEEEKPYREFLVPAVVLNLYGPPRLLSNLLRVVCLPAGR